MLFKILSEVIFSDHNCEDNEYQQDENNFNDYGSKKKFVSFWNYDSVQI